MNLTAKPRRGDMGGHPNQYFTSSATGWWSMGTEWRGAADTVIDLDRKTRTGGLVLGLCGCMLHPKCCGGNQTPANTFTFSAEAVFAPSAHDFLREDESEAVDHSQKTSAPCLSAHTRRNCLQSHCQKTGSEFKRGRWKAYGHKGDRSSYWSVPFSTAHRLSGTCVRHSSHVVDSARQPGERQTCHSVVNYVTRKVTLCKGWDGGRNELRV